MSKKFAILGLAFAASALFTSAAYAEESNQMAGAYQSYEEAGVPADAQEAFDKAMENFDGGENYKALQLLESQVVAGMNYKILCNTTTPEGHEQKVVLTIYKDLNGNSEVTSEVRVIEPENQPVSADEMNFTAKAAFTPENFNWEDQTLTFETYQNALYDMVDMVQLQLDNVIKVGDRYVTVNSIEETEITRMTEDGTEEKVAALWINKDTPDEQFFVANEGGTWIKVGENDAISVVKTGEFTFPLSETMTFTDCTDKPGEKVEVPFDQLQTYMEEKAASYARDYSPLDTSIVVENGQITSIVREWRP